MANPRAYIHIARLKHVPIKLALVHSKYGRMPYYFGAWSRGTTRDLQSRGRRFKSRLWHTFYSNHDFNCFLWQEDFYCRCILWTFWTRLNFSVFLCLFHQIICNHVKSDKTTKKFVSPAVLEPWTPCATIWRFQPLSQSDSVALLSFELSYVLIEGNPKNTAT